MPYTKEQILTGRKAVEDYRTIHNQLRPKPEEHTPLIDKMLADLKVANFTSWDEFNTESELLNVQELGFTSFEDFEKRAKAKDYNTLDGKWH